MSVCACKCAQMHACVHVHTVRCECADTVKKKHLAKNRERLAEPQETPQRKFENKFIQSIKKGGKTSLMSAIQKWGWQSDLAAGMRDTFLTKQIFLGKNSKAGRKRELGNRKSYLLGSCCVVGAKQELRWSCTITRKCSSVSCTKIRKKNATW